MILTEDSFEKYPSTTEEIEKVLYQIPCLGCEFGYETHRYSSKCQIYQPDWTAIALLIQHWIAPAYTKEGETNRATETNPT